MARCLRTDQTIGAQAPPDHFQVLVDVDPQHGIHRLVAHKAVDRD